MYQLLYKHNMEIMSRVSVHAGHNHDVCLSAHGRLQLKSLAMRKFLPISPPALGGEISIRFYNIHVSII